MTYQEFQETPSPDLVVALFGWRTGEHLALFTQAPDDESLHVGHVAIDGFWWLGDNLDGGRKETEVNRLHEAIVPYIAENLRPYVT